MELFEEKISEELVIDHGGRLRHIHFFLNQENWLPFLIEQTAWQQDTITLYGKTHNIPRLHAWLSNENKKYTWSGKTYQAKPFLPLHLKIKEKIETFLGKTFNSCLANYYRNENDYVAWHSDDEAQLHSTIASISFGETRKFKLKHKTMKQLKKDVLLANGSLVVMDGDFQKNWLHTIAKSKKKMSPRVNLTFRNIC